MRHALWLGLFAFTLLAVEAGPARADVPGPDGKYHPKPWGYGAPPPGWFEQNDPPNPPKPIPDPAPKPDPTRQPVPIDPVSGLPYPPPRKPDPPKRTGLFHSCGSGMGVGLAGIGLAWATLWLGNRFAGRINRTAEKRTR